MPAQVKENVENMWSRDEYLTVTGAAIILAELCSSGFELLRVLCVRVKKPKLTTLLCLSSLSGASWNLGYMTKQLNIGKRAQELMPDDSILCSSIRQR